jgi:dienelactone hydrolase
VLGLFGGADPSITTEHVEAFRRAPESSGIRHELVTYEGAPHSFFDRRFTEHAKASHDAWARCSPSSRTRQVEDLRWREPDSNQRSTDI